MSRLDYLEPATSDEAISMLQEYGDEAKVLAGGQSLLMLMRHGLVEPRYLIGLNALEEFKGIDEQPDGPISVGSMVTQRAVERSKLMGEKCSVVQQAAKVVASVPVRNMGTLGGNLCHGDPGADSPAALIAAGACLRLKGPSGTRTLPVEDFFLDYLETALLPAEILAQIVLPAPLPRTGTVYLKCSRRAVDFAVVGVGLSISLDENGICHDLRIGLGGVDVKPLRAVQAERVLRGALPNDQLINEAAGVAADEARPLSDTHASAEYRRKMVAVYVKRAATQALQMAMPGA